MVSGDGQDGGAPIWMDDAEIGLGSRIASEAAFGYSRDFGRCGYRTNLRNEIRNCNDMCGSAGRLTSVCAVTPGYS